MANDCAKAGPSVSIHRTMQCSEKIRERDHNGIFEYSHIKIHCTRVFVHCKHIHNRYYRLVSVNILINGDSR